MASDLKLLAMASAMARHASARHKIVAENIANADTPGYKARDLPAFDAFLATDTTASGAPTASADALMQSFELKDQAASPNGNTVAIEDQMVRSVDAQAQHEMAMTIYRKSLELLRMSASQRR